MPSRDNLELLRSERNVTFRVLQRICGEESQFRRQKGSHSIFTTGFPDNPTVSIQPDKNNDAKPYQVRQVRNLIERRRGVT